MDAPSQLPPILVWIEGVKQMYDLSFWHLLIPAQPLIQHGRNSSFPSPSCLSHDGGNTILTHIQACRLRIVWVAARQIYIDHFKDSCVFLCTAARKCMVSHYIPYPKIAIPHPLFWSNFLTPALIVHLTCFSTQSFNFSQDIMAIQGKFLKNIHKAVRLSSCKDRCRTQFCSAYSTLARQGWCTMNT